MALHMEFERRGEIHLLTLRGQMDQTHLDKMVDNLILRTEKENGTRRLLIDIRNVESNLNHADRHGHIHHHPLALTMWQIAILDTVENASHDLAAADNGFMVKFFTDMATAVAWLHTPPAPSPRD